MISVEQALRLTHFHICLPTKTSATRNFILSQPHPPSFKTPSNSLYEHYVFFSLVSVSLPTLLCFNIHGCFSLPLPSPCSLLHTYTSLILTSDVSTSYPLSLQNPIQQYSPPSQIHFHKLCHSFPQPPSPQPPQASASLSPTFTR